MMLWRQAGSDRVAPPATAVALFQRAIAASPLNPMLHAKLAYAQLDRFDFAAAAASLETALRLDPAFPNIRPRLARCHNVLLRHRDALATLAGVEGPEHERGMALAALDLKAEAEAEFRAVLAADPHHRHACRQLGKLLRKSGRTAELLDMCEHLGAQGVGHAQLLYSWGVVAALCGEKDKARRLLLDPSRVAALPLPVPAGFADIGGFNAALADEILTNPYPISDFPDGEEANRGSSRVHSLLAGRRPELIRQLIALLQETIDAHVPTSKGGFDPWAAARPAAAHLNAWGLIQRGGEYEDWHLHRGGWLSGVYYVRVPKSVSAEGAGRGCIEFGAPTSLARIMPDFVPTMRREPREGMLLLAPSHYPHRTIPTGADEYRISFAFDVVPDDPEPASA